MWLLECYGGCYGITMWLLGCYRGCYCKNVLGVIWFHDTYVAMVLLYVFCSVVFYVVTRGFWGCYGVTVWSLGCYRGC